MSWGRRIVSSISHFSFRFYHNDAYIYCEIIEAFYFRFCKNMLKLKSSTPRVMVYWELGRFPMQFFIQTRIIAFWAKVVRGKQDKLSYRLYKSLYYT